MARQPGLIRRLLGALWRAIDAMRRFVLNLVFLAILVIVLLAWLGGGGRTRILEDTALVIAPKGDIVEQYTGSAREAEFAEALGGEPRETQLRDLVAVLDAAAGDKRINGVVLVLDDMGHAGLAKLRELAAAMERFKASGKKIVAWGSSLDQRQYYLAAHASEIYVHPMGAVALTGFGGYRNYYHDLLERIGITINLYRVGKYKSFAEPFIGNGPSREAAEAEAFWLGDAWRGYTDDVEKARHLPSGALVGLIDGAPARLAATGGNMARLALDEKLVDGLKTRDELRALMLERGKPDNEHKTFRQVAFEEYRGQLPESGDHNRQVGIIVAAGNITDGTEPQGAIGGRSTSELIRRARDDDTIKAVVLRVDSGGGSAFGSELIRREIELTRDAGKPVVVSMGDVAASGGYWITTAANRVLADPGTITGSIGVFGLLPTADRTMDKLGIHTAGTTTTWAAGATDLRRPVDPRLGAIIQSSVEYVYREFLDRVGKAHGMTHDQVNEVAQGRVWTGRQAKERGLIDEMGGLEQAVKDAAKLAKLDAGYRVAYVEVEPKGWGRILASLPGVAVRASIAQALGLAPSVSSGTQQTMDAAQKDLAWISGVTDPTHAYAFCLCSAP